MQKHKLISLFRDNKTELRAVLLGTFVFLGLLSCLIPTNTTHAASRVWPAGYWGPILSCTGDYNNPESLVGVSDHKVCSDFCDLLSTGQNVTDFAMTLVIFVGAPLMLTFGGIMLMIAGAGGLDERRKTAKDIIVSAIIGVGITLSAYLIISTFLWLFGNGPNSDRQVSWPNIVCEVQPAV